MTALFVDTDAGPEEIAAAFRPNTKVLFAETIANPALVILDIEKFAKVAHEHEVPLIVDNTFATPVNCRPFEWGADIVTHSTTKYMDGHAVQVGGAIVDSGNFDWDAYGHKYHGLTEPDESYHGVIYTKQFGKKAYITKATSQLMRDLGSIPSPTNCFLLNLGLETLPLRVERHCYNAQKIAEFLNAHEKVSHVNYAGLPDDKYYPLAQKYMNEGRTCGVISFELTGGREAAVRFMDSLKLATIATHVAASKTMILHPASHTHRQMNDEQLVEAGVSPGMIRLSVGIENVEDIIADIETGIKKTLKKSKFKKIRKTSENDFYHFLVLPDFYYFIQKYSSEFLLKQIYVCIIYAFIFPFLMSGNININTIMFDRTATVLSHINLSIYHNFRTIWNLCRIYSNRTIRRSRHTCGGNPIRPGATADTTWTVMCDLKRSKRFQCCIRRHSNRSSYLNTTDSRSLRSSYSFHSISKYSLSFTFYGSHLLPAHLPLRFSFLPHSLLLSVLFLQNTGWNITNPFLSIIILI